MGTAAEARPTARGKETRTRVLDVAEAAILAKGFEGTSIEEIVAGAAITRSGFFYHFRDKNELARALIERYIEEDRVILEGIFARARELNDDPLHALLIGLKLFSEMLADLPNGHPGCMVASVCYQERLFDAEVRELNRQGVLAWRTRLRPPRAHRRALPAARRGGPGGARRHDLDPGRGRLVVAKALREPTVLPRQILLMRSYIKLLFAPA